MIDSRAEPENAFESINTMVSPFLNWKTTIWFLFVLHGSIDPWWTRTGCQYLWRKWTDPSPKCVYHLEGGQMSQSSWWHRFAELQTIRGNWIIGWRVWLKQIRCRMTELPGFSDRQLISTIGLDTFILNQELYIKNTYSWAKSFNRMTDWSSWSWWTTISLVIRC
jgi:hypothetical protein